MRALAEAMGQQPEDVAQISDPEPLCVAHPTLELLHIERIEPRALPRLRTFWRGMLLV